MLYTSVTNRPVICGGLKKSRVEGLKKITWVRQNSPHEINISIQTWLKILCFSEPDLQIRVDDRKLTFCAGNDR